jgi:hypothetical protein
VQFDPAPPDRTRFETEMTKLKVSVEGPGDPADGLPARDWAKARPGPQAPRGEAEPFPADVTHHPAQDEPGGKAQSEAGEGGKEVPAR